MLDPTAELTPRLYCGVKLTRSWEFAEAMISAVCNAMQGSEPDLRYVRKPARMRAWFVMADMMQSARRICHPCAEE
jgi:hypothetical protein